MPTLTTKGAPRRTTIRGVPAPTAALFALAVVGVPLAGQQSPPSPYALIGTPGQVQGAVPWPAGSGIGQAMDAILDAWGEVLHGVVLVSEAGEITLERTLGFASIELRLPTTLETRYPGAFFGRFLTAAGLGVLVERGLVDLDDQLGRYLDDLPEAMARIPVRAPLSQRSGIDQDLLGLAEAGPHDALGEVADLFALARDAEIAAEPGTYRYSGPEGASTDDVLMASIIERISGRRYEDFVRDEILEPLELHGTGFLSEERLVEGLASTYRIVAGALERYPSTEYGFLRPTGAVYTTGHDVLHFLSEVLDRQRLGREVTRTLEVHLAGATFGVVGSKRVAAEDVPPDARYTMTGAEGWIRGSTLHAYGYRPGENWLIVLSNVHAATAVYDLRRRWTHLVTGVPVGVPEIGRGRELWERLWTSGVSAAADFYRAQGSVVVGDLPITDNLAGDARVLLETRRDAQAVAVASLFAELSPDRWSAHHLMGRALIALGRADEAAAAYRLALSLEPGDPAAAAEMRTFLEARR